MVAQRPSYSHAGVQRPSYSHASMIKRPCYQHIHCRHVHAGTMITSMKPAHPLSPHPCRHDDSIHATRKPLLPRLCQHDDNCHQHIHCRRIHARTMMTSMPPGHALSPHPCLHDDNSRPCYQHIHCRRIHARTKITSMLPAHPLSPHPCRHDDEESPNRGRASKLRKYVACFHKDIC